MLMYDRNQHYIVKQLSSNKKKLIKKLFRDKRHHSGIVPGKPMPPIPTSTSAIKAFKEDGPGVPSLGPECGEYQSVCAVI